jgi:hypothetical protein
MKSDSLYSLYFNYKGSLLLLALKNIENIEVDIKFVGLVQDTV